MFPPILEDSRFTDIVIVLGNNILPRLACYVIVFQSKKLPNLFDVLVLSDELKTFQELNILQIFYFSLIN